MAQIKVCIVGAGVAGLSAAHRLLHADSGLAPEDIVVVEAQHRIGGRVLTSSDSKVGAHYDLGASWFHDSLSNGFLARAVRDGRFSPRRDGYFDDGAVAYYAREHTGALDVAAHKLPQVVAEIEQYIESRWGGSLDTPDESLAAVVRRYVADRGAYLSGAQRQYCGRMVRYLELWYGIGHRAISARYAVMGRQGRDLYNVAGFGRLVARLRGDLGCEVRLGTAVRAIATGPGGHVVTMARTGTAKEQTGKNEKTEEDGRNEEIEEEDGRNEEIEEEEEMEIEKNEELKEEENEQREEGKEEEDEKEEGILGDKVMEDVDEVGEERRAPDVQAETEAQPAKWSRAAPTGARGSQNAQSLAPESLAAEYVVVAVPHAVLALPPHDPHAIVWRPPLPARIRAALGSIHNGALGKVVLEFDSVWWPAHDSFHVLADPDDGSAPDGGVPAPFAYPIHICNMAPHGWPSLVVLVQSPVTEYLESAPHRAWDYLAPMVSKIAPAPTPPIHVVVSAWTQNPYIRGSYTALHVGDDPTDEIVQLCGEHDFAGLGANSTIRFAGDHTVADGAGCVHGAHASGERAADWILQREKEKRSREKARG